MTENFKFCNKEFLYSFVYKPSYYYNQFGIEEATRDVIDSVGEHPKFHIVFNYDEKKKIRATFIVFDQKEFKELDVSCICVLFQGDRFNNYCYFYEVYDDNTIGCIQVCEGINTDRKVLDLNVGTNIDEYFKKLCERFDLFNNNSITMLYYLEKENRFRLLDLIESEFEGRCIPLLGGKPIKESKIINSEKFIFYKSQVNGNYLVARTIDGKNPIDIKFTDIEILK